MGKGGRCIRLTTLPPYCAVIMKSGNINFLELSGPLQACNGTALHIYIQLFIFIVPLIVGGEGLRLMHVDFHLSSLCIINLNSFMVFLRTSWNNLVRPPVAVVKLLLVMKLQIFSRYLP